MPVCRPVRGTGAAGTSAHELHTYQPSASRAIVTVLGACRDAHGGCARWIRPIVERLRRLPSRTAPLPDCGSVQEW
jgi:hypothetical protein